MGFESNQLPANAPIEDRRSAATCLQTRGMLLGVFDGHAGCACAQVKLTLYFQNWTFKLRHFKTNKVTLSSILQIEL